MNRVSANNSNARKRRASRAVLLHGHMFKNAGTTFDWSLQRSFGEAFEDHRDDDAMRRGAAYLGPYIQQRTDLRALSSHWLTLPLPQIADVDFVVALFFRDPIERAYSVYSFERRQQGVDSPGVRQARKLSFRDYIHWRLQPGVGPVIRNFHTRYCSGLYMADEWQQMVTAAVANIQATPLLGLVHRYAESIVLFEYHLQPIFPDLDLSWRVQNSGGEHDLPLSQKRQAVERELGAVTEELIAANQHDLRLYAQVETRFEQALAGIPDIERRLQNLHARNELLS